MIISRRNMNVITKITGNVAQAKAYEQRYISCDDNMLGSKINDRNIKLGLFYEDVLHSIGGQDLADKTLPDSLDWSCPEYQIKTFNVSLEERTALDPGKMEKIHQMWLAEEHDFDKLYSEMMDKWYDKYLTFIPFSKKEWFAGGNKKIEQSRSQFRTDRSEAYAKLPGRQKELGYHKGAYKEI